MDKISKLILNGYYNGIFPMSNSRIDDSFFFVNPEKRAIIPLSKAHVSRSLRRTIIKKNFEIKSNKDFNQVIHSCADSKFGRQDTWINNSIKEVFNTLHESGYAHSVEIYLNKSLVGGIYGISIGSVFFAESMFSAVKNASKIVLIFLLAKLNASKFKLFDVQFMTPHLASMGAIEISKNKFSQLLNLHIKEKNHFPYINSSKIEDWNILLNYLQETKEIS